MDRCRFESHHGHTPLVKVSDPEVKYEGVGWWLRVEQCYLRVLEVAGSSPTMENTPFVKVEDTEVKYEGVSGRTSRVSWWLRVEQC